MTGDHSGTHDVKWRELLTLAEQHLSSAHLDRSDWVWGGGTVLMLKYQHRISWDVDIFLNDPQYMGMISPRLNDTVASSASDYSEQANHTRIMIEDVGEIDYLIAGTVIEYKSDVLEVEGFGEINVMPDREILAQKIQYRGSSFTGRDLFDFAAITAIRPELLEDVQLQKVGEINHKAIARRLNDPSVKEAYESVALHPASPNALSFEQAKSKMVDWMLDATVQDPFVETQKPVPQARKGGPEPT
jgi:hypothetical protein